MILNKILINLFRVILCLAYPAIVFLCFWFILRKNKYKEAFKNNIKNIVVNTIIVLIVAIIGFSIFFSLEDFIYDYDYAGHWVRALTMKEKFLLNPLSIPTSLHFSLNYEIYYSYLIAFFQIPLVMINDSMGFFCFGTFVMFFIPTFIMLQILYFTYYKKLKYLPSFIAVVFYQMYFPILCGETECFGAFFIVTALMLTIFIDFDEIKMLDNVFINFLMFLLIFGRRFYLYAAVAFCFCYFLHYLKHYNFKVFNKEGLLGFCKIISSGLILLIACLLFYRPFMMRAIFNNYAEEYAYNNKEGKLSALISMFSPVVIIVSILGLIFNSKKDKLMLNIELICLIVLPTFMFWQVQNYEYHHYYLIAFPIIVYFTKGLYELFINKKITFACISLYLLIQVSNVYCFDQNMIGFYTCHKTPKIYPKKDEVVSFVNKLEELCDDGSYFCLVSGDGLLNGSVFANAKLPQLSKLNMENYTNEIIDGFPVEMKNCRYVVVSEPVLHQNWDYQNMYDIITYAIENSPTVSKEYSLIYEQRVNWIYFRIYELTGEYSQDIKDYYYNKMIEIYPDRKDFYSNILE